MKRLSKIVFKTWTIPIALFVLTILGFGLLIRGLGFYQDDWYLVWIGHHFGPSIYISHFKDTRPFLAGIYMLTTQLVGTSMLAWQVFGLLTRWLAVFTAWWALRLLWPKHVKEVTWIALLLAIYPGFKQHFLAVVYSNVYIALAAFFFSLGAMLLAIRLPRWRWPLTILAVLAAIFNLLTTEYFFGLELFRPIFLWIIFSEQPRRWRERARLVLVHWAPYLAAAVAFLAWRVFFSNSHMYGPKLAERLALNIITTAINQLQIIIQDAFEASFYAWLQAFDFTKTVYPSLRQLVISWGIFILVAALVAFYLLRLRTPPETNLPAADVSPDEPQPAEAKDYFALQAIFLGVYSTLIAGWPYWFAGLQVDLNNGFDRFTMAYMFGAAILIIGLLELLIKSETAKVVLISLLIGAAVLFQIRIAQVYRDTHIAQADFFRQLIWRAPDLKPGTTLLTNDFPAEYMGNSPMNTAFTWLYTPNTRDSEQGYRLLFLPFQLGSPELPSLDEISHSENILVALYLPQGCVQVIDPQTQLTFPRMTESIRKAVALSNLARVLPIGETALDNYRRLFGKENNAEWCYYFEKADLARQLGNWQEVVRLGDEASSTKLSPNDKFSSELLPFIEGYGRMERWKEALRLSKIALSDVPALKETLCNTWQRIQKNTADSTEKATTLKQVDSQISCGLQ